MAIVPRDNEAFYREVDEELRREQLTSVWQRYGKAMIAGALLLLAAIGGYFWWQHQQNVKAGKQGEQLMSVFDDVQAGKAKQATGKLDQITKDGSPGYRAAALLTKADLAIEDNKTDQAVAHFRTVANDSDMPEPYRQLALVRMTALEFDKLPPQVVIDRLRPLALPGNPWFGSAGEMVAIAYMKQNKPQVAAPIFAAIAKDRSVPASLRSRAVQMAGSLGIDAVQEPGQRNEGSSE